MKLYFLLFLSCFSFVSKQRQSKYDLICKKWQLFGIQESGKVFVPIDSYKTPSILLFKKNGTFEVTTSMYEAQGIWEFNYDSTKFNTKVLNAKGSHLSMLINDNLKCDSVIRLTKDTLIYVSKNNTNWHYTIKQ